MIGVPLLAALALGAAPAARPVAPDTVLLVSVDGLHPAAIAGAPMPRLQRLMRRGVATLGGRSTSPPKTLIAHAAMLTGMAPEVNGKTDNDWAPGEPTVEVRTIFHEAKAAGYGTAYLYSKVKLGFLSTPEVDLSALAPEDGVARAQRHLAVSGRTFTVLHLSGLEHAGARSGWLSPGYLAAARAIDASLAPLLDAVESRGRYLIVVTSDHAGHATEHGTDHPEDGRRPLLASSDLPLWEKGFVPDQAITEVARLLAASWRR